MFFRFKNNINYAVIGCGDDLADPSGYEPDELPTAPPALYLNSIFKFI